MRNVAQLWIGTLLFVVMAVAGCGPDGPRTYPIKGTVTFDGQPVEDGQIVLIPSEKGLTPDAGPIKDGKFSFVAREGRKQVRIEATRAIPGKTVPLAPPMTGTKPVLEMYIPEIYNAKSKLKVTVTDTESDNQFEFALTADGKGV